MQHSPGDVATIGLAAEEFSIALGDLQSRADPREAFTRYKEALSLLRGKEQLMSGERQDGSRARTSRTGR